MGWLAIAFLSALILPGSALAAAPLGYFLHSAGPAATPTMHLGWTVTALSVAVVLIIIGLLAHALMRYRPRADRYTLGQESGGMMFVYISVGLSTLALLAVLFYTLVTVQAVAQPFPAPSLTITVTAYDWWWKVDYPDDAGSAGPVVTANEIHIPVGVPVKIELKSVDVIHAFWVPLLAGKIQAIPGQINTQWIQADKPGVYRGQCGAFCGAQHAHMGFEVIAQSPTQFKAWRDAQARPATAPVHARTRAGQDVFMKRCAGCHAVRGSDASGVFAPDLTHLGSRRLIAAGTLTNTPEHLLGWIQHAQKIKPDSRMPGFSLNTKDADALLAYLATLH